MMLIIIIIIIIGDQVEVKIFILITRRLKF